MKDLEEWVELSPVARKYLLDVYPRWVVDEQETAQYMAFSPRSSSLTIEDIQALRDAGLKFVMCASPPARAILFEKM